MERARCVFFETVGREKEPDAHTQIPRHVSRDSEGTASATEVPG